MLRRNYITALVYGADTWTLKKAQENNIGDRRSKNATMDVRSYEAGQDNK